jgi:hypothetical protein
MPTSHHNQISKILDTVILSNPKIVLDIGVGFGKYGVLLREFLEFWDGRENYKDFLRIIDGIEAYQEYITPVHNYVYNNIYSGDAYEIIPKLNKQYDLTLLIDVLEHFEKEKGISLIKNILQKSKSLLISVPKNVETQGDAFGNPYENHRSHWQKKDFVTLGNTYFVKDEYSIIVYIGDAFSIRNGLKIRKGEKLNQYKLRLISLTPKFILTPYRYIKRKAGLK